MSNLLGGLFIPVMIIAIGIALLSVAMMVARNYKKCPPNQAMILTGRKRKVSDGKSGVIEQGFRTVVGGAALKLPLLERIDIQIQVSRIKYEKLRSDTHPENSESIRSRVEKARRIQRERFNHFGIRTNSEMTHRLVEEFCKMDAPSESLMHLAMEKFLLSIRVYDKILKIARTIADLDSSEAVREMHISEALQYRILDRVMNFVM